MKNNSYILFPGALYHDLVYRCKFTASCWRMWHLEHERKDKKKRTIMCAGKENILMTCGAPVNKSASKCYNVVGKWDSNIRVPEKFLNVVDVFILQKTGHW